MQEPRDGDSTGRESLVCAPLSPVRTFAIPKNRSPGQAEHAGAGPHRTPSFGGSSVEAASVSQIHGHDRNIAPSGLHRIRQQPLHRNPSFSGMHSTMTVSIPSPGFGLGTAPTSPLLSATDDLMRFPSESLHSFSFAQKSDDFMTVRSNVLKRSMELLKDKGMWATGGVALASAQAKVTGDQEVQGMVALLKKANVLGDVVQKQQLALAMGPATGPAHATLDNVFEKSFAPRAQSPEPESERTSRGPTFTFDGPTDSPPPEPIPIPSVDTGLSNPRSMLKRTYTDIASLSLQSKLTEALNQPYIADDRLSTSPTAVTTSDGYSVPAVPFPGFQPHFHGRGGPNSQAIITTSADTPWTITAANDMACLAFGVQRSEIRKLSILDVVREDKRQWLESKLTRRPPTPPKPKTVSPPKFAGMGNGLTARLLSKPSSRETGMGRRTRSYDSFSKAQPIPASEPASRGVILCGDVLPIQKRNGDEGSATVWVQEKRDRLIWVLESIAEDVAIVSMDDIGCVEDVTGKSSAIWGMEWVRAGMDVTRLIPGIPRLKNTNTGALDFEEIEKIRRYTARTINDISIPVTVDPIKGESRFRVSSFPHIAGMLVLSASTLQVSNSNAVVSEALFGRSPNGLHMNELIPSFDKMLNLLVEDDHVALVEGMVLPEHSFRRARSMLALRDGRADAAALFLKPNGVPAIHRDGAEIMVDIQMRVVKSETYARTFSEETIDENEEDLQLTPVSSRPNVVYALWVTYSRSLHAVNHGIGPMSPHISRPGTPPQQPAPGLIPPHHGDDSESDDASRAGSRSSTTSVASSRKAENRLSTGTQGSVESTEDSLPRQSIEDFTILEDMGAGAYGQVKLARLKGENPQKVVIKYVTKRKILVDTWTRDRRLGTVPLEIHVLDYLRRDGHRHPNIVEMIGFFEDDINYYILMKPHGLPGMDLFDYIELRMNMGEDECRRIFRQIVSAVEFLHVKAKVVHRDIKDENVILDGEGRIKLIDFGSASYIKNGPFDVFVGTIDYAAPEVLSGSPYNGLAQDMWALGILLYTILYKENPFYSIDEILDHDLRVPYVVSEPSIELVRGMLERDLDKRLAIQDVVKHAWLQEADEA